MGEAETSATPEGKLSPTTASSAEKPLQIKEEPLTSEDESQEDVKQLDLLQQATRNIFLDVEVDVDIVEEDDDDERGGELRVDDEAVGDEQEESAEGKSMVATRDDWFASSETLPWTSSKIGVYNPVLKVFKCSDCEGCIGFLARVAEHWLGTHANMRVFQCPKCPYNSAWARCVRMHYTRAHEPHGDLPETLMWKSSPVLVQVDQMLTSLKADVESSVIALPPEPPKRPPATILTNQLPTNAKSPKHRSRANKIPPDGQLPERKYACSYCAYSTDRRDLFTRHENIHKEEKPFICFVCSKQFNRADHVKKHFLRIHPETPYDIKRIRRKPAGQESSAEAVLNAGQKMGKNGGRIQIKSFQLYPTKTKDNSPPPMGKKEHRIASQIIFPPVLKTPTMSMLPGPPPFLVPLQILAAPTRPPIPDLILLPKAGGIPQLGGPGALVPLMGQRSPPAGLPFPSAEVIATPVKRRAMQDSKKPSNIEPEIIISQIPTPVTEKFSQEPTPPKRKKPSSSSPSTSSPTETNEEKKYFCSFCPWAGVDSWCLKRHLNTHVKPFTCPLCDYKAARMERLQLHVGRVHCKRICSKCSALFETQEEVDKHVDEEHVKLGQRPPKVICTECGVAVESRSSLESHMIIVHQGSILKCHLCDFCTADRVTLDSHRLDRHPDATPEPNQVDIKPLDPRWSGQGLIFYQQALSALPFPHPPPLALLDPSKLSVSDEEDKPALKRRKQERPQKLGSNTEVTKIYECTRCEERFSKKSGLELHKLSTHGVEQLPQEEQKQTDKFKCGECGKRFQKFAQLVGHLENERDCSSSKK